MAIQQKHDQLTQAVWIDWPLKLDTVESHEDQKLANKLL